MQGAQLDSMAPVDPFQPGTFPVSHRPPAVAMEFLLPHGAPRRRRWKLPRACAPSKATRPVLPRLPRRQDGGVCGTLSGSAASLALVCPPGASARRGAAGETPGRGAEGGAGSLGAAVAPSAGARTALRGPRELEALGRGACWEL